MTEPFSLVLRHAAGFECFAPRSLSLLAFTESAAVRACEQLSASGQLVCFQRDGEPWYHLPGQRPLLPTLCSDLDPALVEAEVKRYIERIQKRGRAYP